MLNEKHEKFIQELVANGGDRKAAYKAAFGDVKDSTAYTCAGRLLRKVEIKSRYEELCRLANTRAVEKMSRNAAEKIQKVEESADAAVEMRAFIIEQLQKIASGEIGDITMKTNPETGNLEVYQIVTRAADIRAALTDLAAYYGVTPQPADDGIRVELVGGAEELAE